MNRTEPTTTQASPCMSSQGTLRSGARSPLAPGDANRTPHAYRGPSKPTLTLLSPNSATPTGNGGSQSTSREQDGSQKCGKQRSSRISRSQASVDALGRPLDPRLRWASRRARAAPRNESDDWITTDRHKVAEGTQPTAGNFHTGKNGDKKRGKRSRKASQRSAEVEAIDDDSLDEIDILSSQHACSPAPKESLAPPKPRIAPRVAAQAQRSVQDANRRLIDIAEEDGTQVTSPDVVNDAETPAAKKRLRPRPMVKAKMSSQEATRRGQTATGKGRSDLDDASGAEEVDTSYDMYTGLPDSVRLAGEAMLRSLKDDPLVEPLDASVDLCPFCDEPMPAAQSDTLKRLMDTAIKRSRGRRRMESRNPAALFLLPSESAHVCARHRDEMHVIPAGLAAGYPAPGTIDWETIPSRIDREASQHLSRVINGQAYSPFFVKAEKEWRTKGAIAMRSAINHFDSFENEVPGYYGLRGLEIFIGVLNDRYIATSILSPRQTAPLGLQEYVRRVLVPESAVCLIQNDRRVDRAEATRTLKASRAYGMAAFGPT